MELSDDNKKEIIKQLMPGFNNNNWKRFECGARAWAEENLADAPFVEEGEDILKPKDIIL